MSELIFNVAVNYAGVIIFIGAPLQISRLLTC
jgi:hypothetical protein